MKMALEFYTPFLDDHKNYIKAISDFSYDNEQTNEVNAFEMPLKLLKTNELLQHLSDNNIHLFSTPNKIQYFDPFIAQECKFISLIQTFSECKSKLSQYANKNTHLNSVKNSLIQINEIIKQTPELTLYLYILKYIQQIYTLKNEKFKENSIILDLLSDRTELKNTKNIGAGIDYLDENFNCGQHERRMFLNQIIYYVLEGKMNVAQNYCMFRKQEEIGQILGGGLAAFDVNLKEDLKDNALPLLDSDLLPPYMKTQTLDEVSSKVNSTSILNIDLEQEQIIQESTFYGNTHWLLWLTNLFQILQENSANSEVNYSEMILFRLLCGYKEDFKLTSGNVYEFLYINLLFYFNSKLIQKIYENPNNIKYEFSEESELQKAYKLYNCADNIGKPWRLFELINYVKLSPEFSVIKEKYPFIDLELNLMMLFGYIVYETYEQRKNEIEDFRSKFIQLLNDFMGGCQGYIDKFNEFCVTKSIVNCYKLFNKDNSGSVEVKNVKMKVLNQMLKLWTSRIIFNILTFSYNSFIKDYISPAQFPTEKISIYFDISDQISSSLIFSVVDLLEKKSDMESYGIFFKFFFGNEHLMTLLKDLSLILRAEGEYDKLIFYLNENFSKVLVKENGHETFNVMEKINEKLLNENKNEIGAFLKKLRGFKSVEEGIEKFVEDNVKSNFNALLICTLCDII